MDRNCDGNDETAMMIGTAVAASSTSSWACITIILIIATIVIITITVSLSSSVDNITTTPRETISTLQLRV